MTQFAVDQKARRQKWISVGAIAAVMGAILLTTPPPGIRPEGWRLLAVFAGTVLGLMLHPLPGGAVVILGVTAVVLTGVMPISSALAGYANPTVWLVLAAFFIARALIKTGLARRIALYFVRAIGHRSLGLAYALIFSDVTLASIIPSNAARAGGVILPIARSLCELYESFPGKTAALLGAFVIPTVYQGDVIASTMFMTGQASNALAADMARSGAGVPVSYAQWIWVALAPALVSLAVVPALLYRLNKPQITHTPAAAQFARDRLTEMGPLSRAEKIVLAIFIGVCALWIASNWLKLHTTLVALLGVCGLFLTGVLTWDDATTEHKAWDVFIWYGGLVRLGEALNEQGITTYLSNRISGLVAGWHWIAVLAAVLAIYFWSHYGFASITSHMVAMYPPFLALLIAKGVPAPLAAYSLAYFANLDASLTHYGTTPAPMYFATGYVSQRTWWTLGFAVALVHITVWTLIGFPWWKLVGLW